MNTIQKNIELYSRNRNSKNIFLSKSLKAITSYVFRILESTYLRGHLSLKDRTATK